MHEYITAGVYAHEKILMIIKMQTSVSIVLLKLNFTVIYNF